MLLKTRESVEVLGFLAFDNFDFTRKIVKKKIRVKNSWKNLTSRIVCIMIMNEINRLYVPIVEPKSRSNGVVSSASSLVHLSNVGFRYWSPIEIESLGEMTSFLLLVFCSIGGFFSMLLDIVHSNVSSPVDWVASNNSLGKSPNEDLFVLFDESLSSWNTKISWKFINVTAKKCKSSFNLTRFLAKKFQNYNFKTLWFSIKRRKKSRNFVYFLARKCKTSFNLTRFVRKLPNDIFGALMTCRAFSSWFGPA